jgi:hypothetical protein
MEEEEEKQSNDNISPQFFREMFDDIMSAIREKASALKEIRMFDVSVKRSD